LTRADVKKRKDGRTNQIFPRLFILAGNKRQAKKKLPLKVPENGFLATETTLF